MTAEIHGVTNRNLPHIKAEPAHEVCLPSERTRRLSVFSSSMCTGPLFFHQLPLSLLNFRTELYRQDWRPRTNRRNGWIFPEADDGDSNVRGAIDLNNQSKVGWRRAQAVLADETGHFYRLWPVDRLSVKFNTDTTHDGDLWPYWLQRNRE